MKFILVILGCCLWWKPVEFESKEECEAAGVRVEKNLKSIFKDNPDIKYRCI